MLRKMELHVKKFSALYHLLHIKFHGLVLTAGLMLQGYDILVPGINSIFGDSMGPFNMASTLAQNLSNIYEMRLLMRNCLKYARNAKMEFYKKECQTTMVP